MKRNFKIEEPEYFFLKDFVRLLAEELGVELVNKVSEFERVKIFEKRLIELEDFFSLPSGSYRGFLLHLTDKGFYAFKNRSESIEKLRFAVINGEIAGLILSKNFLEEVFSSASDLLEKVTIITYKEDKAVNLKSRVNSYLNFCFSPFITCHGSAVEVYGEGVLVLGESGSGKSECVLELVQRGHLFVADDLIKLVNYPPTSIFLMSGSQSDKFKFFMEVRGIGIIDVLRTFGPSRVKIKSELAMVVEIASEEVHRKNGFPPESIQLFGKSVPFFSFSTKEKGLIPTRIETSILEYKLKKFGFETGSVIREVFGGKSDKEAT